MTVEELRKTLERFPKGTRVLVEGYEGGYADIALVRNARVELSLHPEDYMGPHDESPTGTHEAALLIRQPNPMSSQ
jgi:hypothetical protein